MKQELLLETYLRDLRLSRFVLTYQSLAQEAARGNLSYERYLQLVEQGIAANPPPQRKKGTRGPLRGDEVRNLLHRLREYHALILRFMHQLIVPFDNNLAEQDIRMMKVQQKISGCFRTPEGATIFCRLRSYLSTMRKQGIHLLTALHHVFLGSPLLPSLGVEAE